MIHGPGQGHPIQATEIKDRYTEVEGPTDKEVDFYLY